MSASKERRRISPVSTPERNSAIVEVHNKNKSFNEASPSATFQRSRRDSNGHNDRSRRTSKTEDVQVLEGGVQTTLITVEDSSARVQKSRGSWIDSDINVSAEGELEIHQQIKQGIMGFMENEIKKSDNKLPIATLSAYVNGITESEENLRHSKSGSHSGSHREKKSPSRRKKKRISSKHRCDLGSDFDITVSSMSALEKVDDYLKEYNKGEDITLSGDLEIEPNDLVNNNGSSKESKLKPKKRRKSRHEDGKRDKNANTRDVSPRVFDPATGKHIKPLGNAKPPRPTLDLSSMLDGLGSDVSTYNERHIDNPFSSPSPMTSPNDGTLDGAFSHRSDKIYVQRGGHFRAVARDRVLGEAQRRAEERKYFRLSSLTPLDVAISAQGGWRGVATLCHGLLGGLALMHLLALSYGDGSHPGHLSFHAAIIVPYSAAYYFLCSCCLVSVFDSLDIDISNIASIVQSHIRGVVLTFLYLVCMLVTLSSRKFDEMMAFQYSADSNNTFLGTNSTAVVTLPDYYSTWSHLSIWRSIIPIVAAILVALLRQEDILYRELAKLVHFKHSLQSIGG